MTKKALLNLIKDQKILVSSKNQTTKEEQIKYYNNWIVRHNEQQPDNIASFEVSDDTINFNNGQFVWLNKPINELRPITIKSNYIEIGHTRVEIVNIKDIIEFENEVTFTTSMFTCTYTKKEVTE